LVVVNWVQVEWSASRPDFLTVEDSDRPLPLGW